MQAPPPNAPSGAAEPVPTSNPRTQKNASPSFKRPLTEEAYDSADEVAHVPKQARHPAVEKLRLEDANLMRVLNETREFRIQRFFASMHVSRIGFIG